MFVYLIVNDVNGKYYVGKTVNKSLRRYLKQKMSAAIRNPNAHSYLYHAIRKYGFERFHICPLLSTLRTNEELCHWEIELISLFRSRDPKIGYNILPGGGDAPRNKSWREAISEAITAKHEGDSDYRAKMALVYASKEWHEKLKKGQAEMAEDVRRGLLENRRVRMLGTTNKSRSSRTNSPEHRQRQSEAIKRWHAQCKLANLKH